MKTRAFLFFVLLAQAGFAQNLVQNGSFEDYTVCPDGTDIFPTNWQSFAFSPDYYNTCATEIYSSIPLNWCGYQYPSNGNAYCGLINYVGDTINIREYLAYEFPVPLQIGQTYYVEFKVNLAEYYVNDGGTRCASNNIGAKFTTQPFYSPLTVPPILINNFAHVNTSDIITDSINWVTISGSFVADSAYNYIVLGNFFDSFHTNAINFGFSGLAVAYYFFDDICVSTIPNGCGINSINSIQNTEIYLNYIPNNLKISGIKETSDFEIYGISGELIKNGSISDLFYLIDCSDMPKGIYLIRITSHKGSSIHKFIIY